MNQILQTWLSALKTPVCFLRASSLLSLFLQQEAGGQIRRSSLLQNVQTSKSSDCSSKLYDVRDRWSLAAKRSSRISSERKPSSEFFFLFPVCARSSAIKTACSLRGPNNGIAFAHLCRHTNTGNTKNLPGKFFSGGEGLGGRGFWKVKAGHELRWERRKAGRKSCKTASP